MRRGGADDRILGPAPRGAIGGAYQCRHWLLDQVGRAEAETEGEASADFRREMRPQGDNEIVKPDMSEPYDGERSGRREGVCCINQVDGSGNRCVGAGESHRGGIGALSV